MSLAIFGIFGDNTVTHLLNREQPGMDEFQTELCHLAATERQLAQRVAHLCQQLQRADNLDEEQRSELYTILQALRHESQFSAEQIESLLGRAEDKHV